MSSRFRNNSPMQMDEQFKSLILHDPRTDCWIWTGPLQTNGRPMANHIPGRPLAHLVAWEHTHNTTLNRRRLTSTCGQPFCINPAHHTFQNKHQRALNSAIGHVLADDTE